MNQWRLAWPIRTTYGRTPAGSALTRASLDYMIEPRWCDANGQGRTQPGECHVQNAVAGVTVGCFPDLYAALAGNPPDQVITL
jgi:hypothetical protein